MRRVHVAFWLFLAAVALNSRVDACSCIVGDHGFVVATGTVLPANAVGVPWWSAREAFPDKSWFSVERIDGGRNEPIAFHVEPAGDPYGFAAGAWDHSPLALVVPDGGVIAGARYRLVGHPPDRLFVDGKMVDEQAIEITVSTESFRTGSANAVIEMDKPRISKVRTSTRGGSCSVTIDASQAHLYFLLPPALERWKDALQYTVVVDSLLWNPSEDVCNRTPPGMSWIGRAEEIVFTHCRRKNDYTTPELSLPEGEHKVTFTAWLPGTDLTLSASTTVTLSCDEFEKLDIIEMGQ